MAIRSVPAIASAAASTLSAPSPAGFGRRGRRLHIHGDVGLRLVRDRLILVGLREGLQRLRSLRSEVRNPARRFLLHRLLLAGSAVDWRVETGDWRLDWRLEGNLAGP